jgi:16S rRNA (guanine(966)-N(2))-methyltransferase RsmD
MRTLRVISGTAGGLHLKSVPGDIVRPITDRVKEALFNIIDPDIYGASFLDLFSGTGSVGIEALSRGASYVRFVERHPLAVKTIRANLEHTKLTAGADVYHADAFSMLKSGADRDFDYIYIAPPQYKRLWRQSLEVIDLEPAWLSDKSWVIVQIDPVEYEKLKMNFLREFDQRRYGSTLLVFFEHLPEGI